MLQRHLNRVVTRVSDLFPRHYKIYFWLVPNARTDSYLVAVETIPVLDHAYVIGLLPNQIEFVHA